MERESWMLELPPELSKNFGKCSLFVLLLPRLGLASYALWFFPLHLHISLSMIQICSIGVYFLR